MFHGARMSSSPGTDRMHRGGYMTARSMKGKYDTLRVEEKPGDLLLATLSRPEVANAFNTRAALDLCEFFESLDAERRCRRVVLTGAGGKALCPRADLEQRDARRAEP